MLNRFISRPIDKCLPFFKLLKGNKKFKWTDECHNAFDKFKRYLSTFPILAKPLTGEKLLLYLAVTEASVSAAMIRDLNNEQQSIFYINKSLFDAKTRYPIIEMLAFVLVTVA